MCLFLTLRPADRSSHLPAARDLASEELVVQEQDGALVFTADGTCGWAGEPPRPEMRCTMAEMAERIRGNRLATQGRYRVSRWAAA
jgi:hypothetical protein